MIEDDGESRAMYDRRGKAAENEAVGKLKGFDDE